MHKCLRNYIVPAILLAGLLSPAVAQKKYALQVEVMTQPSPTDRLNAQKWGNALLKMNRRATFRKGHPGEKTRVEEPKNAIQKTVKVVGIMNRNGTLSFGRHTFVITQPEAMQKWLNSLEQYGAGGPPNESTTWGLSEDQLTSVLKLLGDSVDQPVRLRSPVEAIDSLNINSAFRLSFTDAARKRASVSDDEVDTTDDFRGLTKGSVLAAALAQFGLGFRPKADDRGGYVLEIDAGNESDNMFPVGWKNTSPITLVVPKLARSMIVDLDKPVPLDGLIDIIAGKVQVPHFYSSYELKVARKDLSKIMYTRKRDRLTPYTLMGIVGKTHNIGISPRTDEAGNVFLWVTTEAEYAAFRKRFDHIKPAP